MTRGGRRPGAGAPKGNKNAFKHGRHSRDPYTRSLRKTIATLTPEQLKDLDPVLQKGLRSINRERAWRKWPAIVVPFPSASSSSSGEQSNIDAIISRLDAHGFNGAWGHVKRHMGALREIEKALDAYEALPPQTLAQVTNHGGLIWTMFHEEIFVGFGGQVRCPYCGWQPRRQEEEASGG